MTKTPHSDASDSKGNLDFHKVSLPAFDSWPTSTDDYANWIKSLNETGTSRGTAFTSADVTAAKINNSSATELTFDTPSLYSNLITMERAPQVGVSDQTKNQRGTDIDKIMANGAEGPLSKSDGKTLGDWLAKNKGKIDGVQSKGISDPDEINFKDGAISYEELKHIYENNQWPDGTKLSKEDALMLRQAAQFFEQYSSQGVLSKTLIEDLQAGAKFTFNNGIITAVRPDGTKTDYTAAGSHTTKPDGTEIFRSVAPGKNTSEIVMNPDGTGHATITFLGQKGTPCEMKRGEDGSWTMMDPDGKPIAKLRYDKEKGTFSFTSEDGDSVEVTMKTPGKPVMTVTNPDGSVSTTELTTGKTTTTLDDGTPITITPNDQGVVKGVTNDGHVEYTIPTAGITVERPAGGGTNFVAEQVRVEVGKDGQVKVFDKEGNQLPTKRGKDGNISATEGDVRVIVKPNGVIDVATGHGDKRINVVLAGGKVYTRFAEQPTTEYELPKS